MAERIDMGADMSPGHDDLVGRGIAAGALAVAVPPLKRHPKLRMIRRLRHSFGHRMHQIDYPRAAEPIGNAVNVHSATISHVGRNDYDGGTAITPVVQPRPPRLPRTCIRTQPPRSTTCRPES